MDVERDPFILSRFGLYHIWLGAIFFKVWFLFSWLSMDPKRLLLNEKFRCHHFKANGTTAHEPDNLSLISLFHWHCYSESIEIVITVTQTTAVFLGSFVWYHFAFWYGPKRAIVASLGLNISNNIVFLLWSRPEVFYCHIFLQKFSTVGMLIYVFDLYIESIQYHHYYSILIINFLKSASYSCFTSIAQLIFTSWQSIFIVKSILGAIVLVQVYFIVDSARWSFIHGDCKTATRKVKAMNRLNKDHDPSRSIGAEVNKAWQLSRGFPKDTAIDSIFGFLRFPLARDQLIRYGLIIIIVHTANNISRPNMAHSSVFYLRYYDSTLVYAAGFLIWLALSYVGEGKKIMSFTFLIGGLIFFYRTIHFMKYVVNFHIIVSIILSVVLLMEMFAFQLNFFPMTLLKFGFIMNLICIEAARFCTVLLKKFDIAWFPWFFFCVAYLFGSYISCGLVERKFLTFRLNLREVEKHLEQHYRIHNGRTPVW